MPAKGPPRFRFARVRVKLLGAGVGVSVGLGYLALVYAVGPEWLTVTYFIPGAMAWGLTDALITRSYTRRVASAVAANDANAAWRAIANLVNGPGIPSSWRGPETAAIAMLPDENWRATAELIATIDEKRLPFDLRAALLNTLAWCVAKAGDPKSALRICETVMADAWPQPPGRKELFRTTQAACEGMAANRSSLT